MAGRLSTDQDVATAATEGYSLVLAAELEFATQIVRYHTGGGELEIFPGRIFSGVGDLGRISNASETEALADSRLELAITGLDPTGANLTSVFNEDIRGRPATLWLVMINNALERHRWTRDSLGMDNH